MIENKIVRVARQEVMSYLKPRLDGYRSSWSRVYIGVTAAPEKRWAKHMLNGWAKMVLLYEAYRPDIARDLEQDLIDYARRCNFLMPIENITLGGEGIGDKDHLNYLYVLVGR